MTISFLALPASGQLSLAAPVSTVVSDLRQHPVVFERKLASHPQASWVLKNHGITTYEFLEQKKQSMVKRSDRLSHAQRAMWRPWTAPMSAVFAYGSCLASGAMNLLKRVGVLSSFKSESEELKEFFIASSVVYAGSPLNDVRLSYDDVRRVMKDVLSQHLAQMVVQVQAAIGDKPKEGEVSEEKSPAVTRYAEIESKYTEQREALLRVQSRYANSNDAVNVTLIQNDLDALQTQHETELNDWKMVVQNLTDMRDGTLAKMQESESKIIELLAIHGDLIQIRSETSRRQTRSTNLESGALSLVDEGVVDDHLNKLFLQLADDLVEAELNVVTTLDEFYDTMGKQPVSIASCYVSNDALISKHVDISKMSSQLQQDIQRALSVRLPDVAALNAILPEWAQLVHIPGAVFKMGNDGSIRKDEGPAFTAVVSPFHVMEAAVSNAAFREFESSSNSDFGAHKFLDNDRPAVEVTWDKAKACAAWMNERYPVKGMKWRLQREAEKDLIMRDADLDTVIDAPSHDRVNWRGNNQTLKVKDPQYRGKNGVYHGRGNVWEWCEDPYGQYPSDVVINYRGADNSNTFVLRGGSYSSNVYDARLAYRGHYDPDSRFNIFGFRLVLVPETT